MNGRLMGVMDVIDAMDEWVSWISCVMDVMDVIPPWWARMDISVFESKPDEGLILRDANDKSTNHPTDDTKHQQPLSCEGGIRRWVSSRHLFAN